MLCSVQGCPRGVNLNGIACDSIHNCYAIGMLGSIFHTADGGKIWRFENSGTDITLRGNACPAVDRCYAVGEGGVILGMKIGPPTLVLPADDM